MNDGLWLWPWEECGEVFFGWMEPGQINGMDFTIARRCNLPKDHRGSCDFCRVYPAGFFPLRENRTERRQRLVMEKKRKAVASR